MTDYTLGDTIYIAFTTRSFSTGAPTQLAGTPAVSAYENASLTQITAGITLGVDHDSVTGLNMITVVATSGNGYSTAKDYHLVITTGTVGGVSVVGEVVGRFTLSRASAVQAAERNAVADAVLNRDMSAVSDTNARSPINALRFLRNKWSISGTTLTVTKEDDSTSAWTATVTADATANPITGNDPA